MLIIFDLDDTLVETSSSVTPVILEHIFLKLLKNGLCVKDEKKELNYLLKLNKEESSSKNVIKKFLKKHKLEKFYDFSIKELYNEDFVKYLKIKKNVKKVLHDLYKKHYLALVTVGKDSLQKKKLINAGIDYSIFSIIDVVNESNKRPSYKRIIDLLEIDPKFIIVCGDRISVDLEPAKSLGCTTILMKGGRGKCESSMECVDYLIDDIEEMKYIIKNILGEKNGF